jgi:hypothetical protein
VCKRLYSVQAGPQTKAIVLDPVPGAIAECTAESTNATAKLVGTKASLHKVLGLAPNEIGSRPSHPRRPQAIAAASSALTRAGVTQATSVDPRRSRWSSAVLTTARRRGR